MMDRRSGINTALKSQKSALLGSRSHLASLDSYLVSITELEGKHGVAMVGIDAPQSLKASRAPTTWTLPAGCSLS